METAAPTTAADSAQVDSQPSSGAQPVTNTSAGIAPVADFIPSDAKLDQPTLSPSEPSATGESHVDADATMTDVQPPASDPQAPDSNPQPEDVKIATENGIATESAPTNGTMNESQASHDATAPSQDASSEPATAAPPADQAMTDAPPSGIVRARDEDETSGEPSAKRTKLEADTTDNAQAEFKKPNAPVAVAAPATNGNGVHAPKTPSFSSSPMTSTQRSILVEKMKNTKKVKSALWFLKPVDYVALNIPHYPTIIKTPMDLSTMERKLKDGQYGSVDAFVADFELIVSNSVTFNGAQHAVSFAAQNLRAYFMKQMESVPTGAAAVQVQKPVKKAASATPVTKTANVSARRESRTPAVPGATRSPVAAAETFALLPGGTPMIRRDSTAAGRPKRAVIPPAPRDLPYATSKPKRKESQMGLKFCEHIVDEFRKPKYDRFAGAFRIPVDPVALNIPMYFSIIKHPMDLSTMTNKLKSGQYSTAAEFKSDADLMFSNCFKFNPPDNIVNQMGKEFEREFSSHWSRKDAWIKKNTPQSQRASSASDVGSDGDDSDEEADEDAENDSNEATILALRQQLEEMQNMLGSISGAKRASPGGKSKKKGKTSKPSKKSAPAPSRVNLKSKPKKQRLVTYEEKQEISSATEKMEADQVEKLTQIITENVSKYKDMPGDDVELEIDDLPNEVQHKLLKYVRSIFPPRAPTDDGNAVDDDYEPERPSNRGGAAKKKHKPMKKHEQESRIAQLKQQMAQMSGSTLPNSAANPAPQSSSDEDSESSEEE